MVGKRLHAPEVFCSACKYQVTASVVYGRLQHCPSLACHGFFCLAQAQGAPLLAAEHAVHATPTHTVTNRHTVNFVLSMTVVCPHNLTLPAHMSAVTVQVAAKSERHSQDEKPQQH